MRVEDTRTLGFVVALREAFPWHDRIPYKRGHGHGAINFSNRCSPRTGDTRIPKTAQAHSSN